MSAALSVPRRQRDGHSFFLVDPVMAPFSETSFGETSFGDASFSSPQAQGPPASFDSESAAQATADSNGSQRNRDGASSRDRRHRRVASSPQTGAFVLEGGHDESAEREGPQRSTRRIRGSQASADVTAVKELAAAAATTKSRTRDVTVPHVIVPRHSRRASVGAVGDVASPASRGLPRAGASRFQQGAQGAPPTTYEGGLAGFHGDLYGEQLATRVPLVASTPTSGSPRSSPFESLSPKPPAPRSAKSQPLPRSQPHRFRSQRSTPEIPLLRETTSDASERNSSENSRRDNRPRRIYSSDAIPLPRGSADVSAELSPRTAGHSTPPRSPLSRSPLPRSPLALGSPLSARSLPEEPGNAATADRIAFGEVSKVGASTRENGCSRRLKREKPVPLAGASATTTGAMAAEIAAADVAGVPLDLLVSARKLMAECEARGVRWELLKADGARAAGTDPLKEPSGPSTPSSNEVDADFEASSAALQTQTATPTTPKPSTGPASEGFAKARFGSEGKGKNTSSGEGGISRQRRLAGVDPATRQRKVRENDACNGDKGSNSVFRNASGGVACDAGDLHVFVDKPTSLLQDALSSATACVSGTQTENGFSSSEESAVSSPTFPVAPPAVSPVKSALPISRLRRGRVSSCSSLPISASPLSPSSLSQSPLSTSPLSPSPLSPSPLPHSLFSPLSDASPPPRKLPMPASPSPSQPIPVPTASSRGKSEQQQQQQPQQQRQRQLRALGKHGSLEQLSGFFSGMLSLSRSSSGSRSSSPCPSNPGSSKRLGAPLSCVVNAASMDGLSSAAQEALLQSGQPGNKSKPTDFILRMPYEDIKGRYSLGRKEIGEGRFGSIRTCLERSTGSFFACKTISKRNIETHEEAEDVRQEVMFLAMLKGHPNIVSLKEALEDKKAVHLIMELCPGGDLFDRIKSKGQLSEPEAAGVLRQLLEALIHTHSLGIIHRDIKPENILLSSPSSCSHIKLIDYGVATVLRDGSECTEMAGTPEYMAPEVYNEKYGVAADVWGAGVSLYVILSGIPPFWESTNRSLEEAIKKKKVSFKHWKWATVSTEAKELIMRMLEKDPQRRITAQEALEHPWITKLTASSA